jgi:hypothetical protein
VVSSTLAMDFMSDILRDFSMLSLISGSADAKSKFS